MTEEQADQILKELVMLRKLRIAELSKQGFSQADLAHILGLSQPTISRMVPNVTGKKKVRSNE